MAFTQITTSNLDNTITTKLAAAEAANAAVANIVSLAISSVQIADSSYNVLDDTAANTGGGYLVINGTGFTNQCVVIVGTTNATSTTFANTKQLRAQVTGLAAATYPVYVVDTATGATAIRVNGLTYSSFPAWSTGSSLSNQNANTAFAVNLSATSDSSVTYANTTALPAGTTLAANGLFSGTVSIGAQTTYSFDVRATDAENQDTTRTFSLTVTVIPPVLIFTWGRNGSGQIGNLTVINVSSPTQIGSSSWANVASRSIGTILATRNNGTLWAWGGNNNGQLGINNTVYQSSPIQIGTNTDWSLIKTGSYHIMAIKTNGTLWSWGKNHVGQLGFNDRVDRSSPTQIGTDTNWRDVFPGPNNVMAIKTNGTLWAWGQNNRGELSLGDTAYRSSPVQVGTATNWSTADIGSFQSNAIKTDGTLWASGGDGLNGTMGLNQSSTLYRSSSVQVGLSTNWSKVSISGFSAFAIKTDGTLWSWGANPFGQLGISNRTTVSSPTQVGTNTNWSLVQGFNLATGALKTDGTLWTWGFNGNGELGQNNLIYRSSPTQIGAGTTWLNASFGYTSIATRN